MIEVYVFCKSIGKREYCKFLTMPRMGEKVYFYGEDRVVVDVIHYEIDDESEPCADIELKNGEYK